MTTPALTHLAQKHGLSVDQLCVNLLRGLVFPMHHVIAHRPDITLTLEDFFTSIYADSVPALAEIDLDQYQERITKALADERNVNVEEAYKIYGRVWALQQMAKQALKGDDQMTMTTRERLISLLSQVPTAKEMELHDGRRLAPDRRVEEVFADKIMALKELQLDSARNTTIVPAADYYQITAAEMYDKLTATSIELAWYEAHEEKAQREGTHDLFERVMTVERIGKVTP